MLPPSRQPRLAGKSAVVSYQQGDPQERLCTKHQGVAQQDPMSVELTIAHGSYPLIHADSIAQDLGLILCPAQDMARARSCAWFWHRIKYDRIWELPHPVRGTGSSTHRMWQCPHPVQSTGLCTHAQHPVPLRCHILCAPCARKDAETDPVRMFHCVGCAVCALEALRGHTGGKQCRRHLPRSCAQDPVPD